MAHDCVTSCLSRIGNLSRSHESDSCIVFESMLIVVLVGIAIVVLAHTAPAPFVLDAMAGTRAVWHMPRTAPPPIFLTFDDGPHPAPTPDLLAVLRREGSHATSFVIARHIPSETD